MFAFVITPATRPPLRPRAGFVSARLATRLKAGLATCFARRGTRLSAGRGPALKAGRRVRAEKGASRRGTRRRAVRQIGALAVLLLTFQDIKSLTF